MANREYSQHQKSVISNYYSNLDTIMLQKLSDLVGELYLAEPESAKRTPLTTNTTSFTVTTTTAETAIPKGFGIV